LVHSGQDGGEVFAGKGGLVAHFLVDVFELERESMDNGEFTRNNNNNKILNLFFLETCETILARKTIIEL
jgi:hypothetical protein